MLINKGENTRTKKCFIKKICKRYVLHMENENINIYYLLLFILIIIKYIIKIKVYNL